MGNDEHHSHDDHQSHDDHHSHDDNHAENGPDSFSSESLDLENEIKGIYSTIGNDDILDDHHIHSGNERHGHSEDHHGHAHLSDELHEHDKRSNDTEHNLHESMFLTLQNGR